MKAKSIQGSTIEEISLAFQQSREDGFTPTLAIVFISIKQDREAVRDLLRKEIQIHRQSVVQQNSAEAYSISSQQETVAIYYVIKILISSAPHQPANS